MILFRYPTFFRPFLSDKPNTFWQERTLCGRVISFPDCHMTVIIAPQLSKALFILAIGYIRFQTFHTNNRNLLPIIISSHMPAHIMNCPFFTGKPFLKMTDNEGQHMMRRMNGRIKHSLRQFAEPYDSLEFSASFPAIWERLRTSHIQTSP